jgi:hypothetical protein
MSLFHTWLSTVVHLTSGSTEDYIVEIHSSSVIFHSTVLTDSIINNGFSLLLHSTNPLQYMSLQVSVEREPQLKPNVYSMLSSEAA